ncbi:CRPV-138 [Crowpox virus]|nr:CRPV-138 [Crowpox virus]
MHYTRYILFFMLYIYLPILTQLVIYTNNNLSFIIYYFLIALNERNYYIIWKTCVLSV